SHIPDTAGRVGNHPRRVEAESMSLDGYASTAITPEEDASGGKAVLCEQSKCTATAHFDGKAGWYRISIQYFDQRNGASHFEAFLNRQKIGAWIANDTLPNDKPNADTSTRITFAPVALRPGDEIQVAGFPDGGERAALDYVEIEPANEN